MTLVPVIYSEIPSLESTLRNIRRGEGRLWWCQELVQGWAFLDELCVGGDIWLQWHLLWHFFCVQNPSVSTWKLVTLQAQLPKYQSIKRLWICLPTCFFVFWEKSFTLKTTFYSFSFKGFHYQFLIWRICLWIWNPCRHDPSPPRRRWASCYWPIHVNLPSWSQHNSPWISCIVYNLSKLAVKSV